MNTLKMLFIFSSVIVKLVFSFPSHYSQDDLDKEYARLNQEMEDVPQEKRDAKLSEKVVMSRLETKDEVKKQGRLETEINDEIEKNRGLLYRRTLRVRIDTIETEFKQFEYYADIVKNDPKLLQDWTSQNHPAPHDKEPAKYVRTKTPKIEIIKTILDLYQEHRESRWNYYLANPPPVDFMPEFFKFRERLVQSKDLTLTEAAYGIGKTFRILSSPYHEDGDILLDELPVKTKITVYPEANKVVSILMADLDAEKPKKLKKK